MVSFAFLIIIGVTSLSLNLVQVSNTYALINSESFLINYGGEEIQSHGMEFCKAT